MSAVRPRARAGAGTVLLVFALALAGLGLGLDLLFNRERGFWAGAEPGARALIGVGAGVAVVLAGHAMRWLLARPHHDANADKEDRRAGDHP